MSTTPFVRRHIFRLPLQKLFTTREFLLYGPRAAIDQALSRLVKKGVIVRLTRGVFVRSGSNLTTITPFDLAKAKADSFGKQIARWGGDLAYELRLIEKPCNKHIFCVNGSSSSFKFGDITIQLKKTCARKMRFGDNKAGVVLRALWHLGKLQVNALCVDRSMLTCKRQDQHEIRSSLCWLPTWLSKHFIKMTLPREAFLNYPPLETVVRGPL